MRDFIRMSVGSLLKIDDEIAYHKELEEMALRAGDFTKAEHHRRMQEIFSALREKSQKQQQQQP